MQSTEIIVQYTISHYNAASWEEIRNLCYCTIFRKQNQLTTSLNQERNVTFSSLLRNPRNKLSFTKNYRISLIPERTANTSTQIAGKHTLQPQGKQPPTVCEVELLLTDTIFKDHTIRHILDVIYVIKAVLCNLFSPSLH